MTAAARLTAPVKPDYLAKSGAGLAQLVELQFPILAVAGSNPVARSNQIDGERVAATRPVFLSCLGELAATRAGRTP